MKFRLKGTVAGMAAAVVVLATAGAAFATPPPFEPDPNTVGACQPTSGFCDLRLYDATGKPVTGGSINAFPFVAYAQADQLDAAPDIKAQLQLATPVFGANPGTWTGFEAITPSTAFPNAAAPAPLNHTGAAGTGLPLVTLGTTAGNETIATYISHFPNNDTTDADAGIYQIRMVGSGGGGGVNYWSADIHVDSVAQTWTLVYPGAANTSGAITTSPASPQNTGTAVTITDTVTPINADGTVQFFADGSTLGSPVSSTAGAAAITNSGFSAGTHSITATFTPANLVAFNGNTSPSASYTLNQAAAVTTTTNEAVNTGAGQAFSPVTFTATVSPGSAPGTVSFVDGSTLLGTVGPSSGTFILVDPNLGPGSHSVVANFSPSNSLNFTASSSAAMPFTLAAPACVSCTDVQTIELSIPAGTLLITTPYSPANPLNLGPATLNASATQFNVTGTFGGIYISDTRAGDLPWTATAQSSPLTGANPVTETINDQNVGLTGLTAVSGTVVVAGNVTLSDNPAANPALAIGAGGTQGLGNANHTFAHANLGDGTLGLSGTLTVTAPSSTPAGLYTGTITFTIG